MKILFIGFLAFVGWSTLTTYIYVCKIKGLCDEPMAMHGTYSIGSYAYNQALGNRRAESTRQFFESRGILQNNIIIDSKGEKEPADDNSTITGRANNRRTTITIKK